MKLRVIFTFLILLSAHISFSQISGTYIYSAGMDAGTRTLTFNGSNFTDKSTGHLNEIFGEGSFKLENNFLTLNYFKLNDKDSSIYKIDSGKALYGYSSIFAKVFAGKLPLNGASVVLSDNTFERLFSVSTLADGSASFTVFKNEKIKYLTIDYLGYKRIIIPFDNLKGRNNDIFAELKDDNLVIEPQHAEVYRVKEKNDTFLKLVDSGKTELVFKKTGK